MTKRWVLVDFDSCPNCGNDAEILTDCEVSGFYWDGDSAKCCECGTKGVFSCDGENNGYINWDDE